jgi:flavin reductase (DIM6/NTAB) family NADH-FMN oxidoreductase RutF
MTREPIPLTELALRPFAAFDQDWFLLAAGSFADGDYNAMTISWGSVGVIWGRPFVQVVVRPTRHTFSFMERFPTFTVSTFDAEERGALNLLGSRSGRDGNKIEASGLTPTPSRLVAAPCFAEATLVLECRKVYYDDLEPAHFLAEHIAPHYENDFHRAYFGEIVGAFGTEAYRSR